MVPEPNDFSRLSLYSVLDSLPDGVALADAEGRIVFSNEAADRILGTPVTTEVTPDEWAEYYGVFLPDGATPFPTEQYPLVRALSGEAPAGVEMVIRNAAIPEGSIISVSGRPVRDDGGTVIGAAAVFRDITQRHTAQRLRDELTTLIVHDLRNPLSVIFSTSEILLASDEVQGSVRQDVGEILTASKRMHRMVTDLLDIKMAEDGALQLELAPVAVEPLLATVAQSTRPRLTERNTRVEVMEMEPLSAAADEAYLFRVLVNLVDNCAQYGPAGGTVRLGADRGAGGKILIHVSDDGPGVPEQLRERIFEKYAQLDRDESTRSLHARGLGLRFCKVITEAQAGRIWVDDADRDGARFCLELASA